MSCHVKVYKLDVMKQLLNLNLEIENVRNCLHVCEIIGQMFDWCCTVFGKTLETFGNFWKFGFEIVMAMSVWKMYAHHVNHAKHRTV